MVPSELRRLGAVAAELISCLWTGWIIELCLETRWALISEGCREETGQVNRSGGPCREGLREGTNQSTLLGLKVGERRALEISAHLPEHPTSLAWPEGEFLV